MPTVEPAGCAEARCATGTCTYQAIDKDGDGHRTATCKITGASATLEVGDDCNDASPDVFPGAWDGPAGDGKPDRCKDGVDQNCSGADGDSVLANGKTCVCTPGDVSACSEDSAGKPLQFPGGKPIGICKLGNKTCLANGSYGPCTGYQLPLAEACNGTDDDCNGFIDDSFDVRIWYYDLDGDGHAAKSIKGVNSCAQPKIAPDGCCANGATTCKECPTDRWVEGAVPDDCDDKQASVYPAAPELCDGLNNNCDAGNKIDENLPPSTDPCTVGVGACARTGVKVCSAGAYGGCSVAAGPPSAETCDEADRDCDGVPNNGPLPWNGQAHPRGACVGTTASTNDSGYPLPFSVCGGDAYLGGDNMNVYASVVFRLDGGNAYADIHVVLYEPGGDFTAYCTDTSFALGGSGKVKSFYTSSFGGGETIAGRGNVRYLGSISADDGGSHDFDLPFAVGIDGQSQAFGHATLRIVAPLTPGLVPAGAFVIKGSNVFVEEPSQ